MKIERVMMSTAGSCGDLQGIVGRSLVQAQLEAPADRVIGQSQEV